MNKWTNDIDQTTREFVKCFGSLTSEELNWKPNAETWSIGQNLDHLVVINQSYFPILSNLRSGQYRRPFVAKFGFIVSFLGKAILKSVQPDRSKRIKTFPIWEPAKSDISSDIVERFSNHQTQLKMEIEASAGLISRKCILSSPANRNIVYRLETAFDIIVAHEKRHLQQAKETFKLLKAAVKNQP